MFAAPSAVSVVVDLNLERVLPLVRTPEAPATKTIGETPCGSTAR